MPFLYWLVRILNNKFIQYTHETLLFIKVDMLIMIDALEPHHAASIAPRFVLSPAAYAVRTQMIK